MDTRIRLGMLTPSSNTVLEPVSTAIAAGLPEVSVHFGRFKVTEIALSEQALKQSSLWSPGSQRREQVHSIQKPTMKTWQEVWT